MLYHRVSKLSHRIILSGFRFAPHSITNLLPQKIGTKPKCPNLGQFPKLSQGKTAALQSHYLQGSIQYTSKSEPIHWLCCFPEPGGYCLQQDADAADDGGQILLHPLLQPVGDHPHQSVLAEIHQNAPILQGYRQAGRQLPGPSVRMKSPGAGNTGLQGPGVGELNT